MKTRIIPILFAWLAIAILDLDFGTVKVVTVVNALRVNVWNIRADGDELPHPGILLASDITIVSGFNSPAMAPTPAISTTSGFHGPNDITTTSGHNWPGIQTTSGFTCPADERCGSGNTSGNLSSSINSDAVRLSKGAIAGIVIGAIALCALIAGLLWLLVRRRKSRSNSNRLSHVLEVGNAGRGQGLIVEKGMRAKGKENDETSSSPSDTSSQITSESFASPYERRMLEVRAI